MFRGTIVRVYIMIFSAGTLIFGIGFGYLLNGEPKMATLIELPGLILLLISFILFRKKVYDITEELNQDEITVILQEPIDTE